MSCDRVRRVLLAAEAPEPPPLDVRPHLAECRECRAWLHRLGTMERQLAVLPVPPSAGKDRLLRQLRDLGPGRLPLPSQSMPWPAQLKERGLRKLSVAFALAATVAAFAVGLWLWPHRDRLPDHLTGPDRVAVWEVQRAKRVAHARTPGEHVKGLSEFAVKLLQDEAADLARKSDGEQLELLAGYYERLICQYLVETAQSVPKNQRSAVFREVRGMLSRTESQIERLAVDLPGAAKPLRQIASTAREGDRRLRALLEAGA